MYATFLGKIFNPLFFYELPTFKIILYTRVTLACAPLSQTFGPFTFTFFFLYSLLHNGRKTVNEIPTVSKKRSPWCCSWAKTASSDSPSAPDMVAGEPAGAVTVAAG